MESALPILKFNIELNEKLWKDQGGDAQCQVLEWGKEINLNFEPQIILLADCVYYKEVSII